MVEFGFALKKTMVESGIAYENDGRFGTNLKNGVVIWYCLR